MIHMFLADNNGVFVDSVSLRTDEDGFIHPLQAVYEILKVWDVAIDHMLWKENDC